MRYTETGVSGYADYVTYPSSQDLIDGSALLQRALGDHIRTHLFHVEHEGVKRLLDVRSFGLLLLSLFVLGFPAGTKKITTTQEKVKKKQKKKQNS